MTKRRPNQELTAPQRGHPRGLADKLEVSFKQIQKYELGKNQVGPTRLLQLAKIFGVSVGFLLGETQPRKAGVQLPGMFASDLDRDAVRMFEAFQKLRDRGLRRKLSLLTQRMAALDGEV